MEFCGFICVGGVYWTRRERRESERGREQRDCKRLRERRRKTREAGEFEESSVRFVETGGV